MCPCQCKSQVPWIQAGFPIHDPTKPGTYLVLQYYIRSAHAWLHNPCLKTSWQPCRGNDFSLCEGGRQDNSKSRGGFGLGLFLELFWCVWQPAWGSPAEAEARPGNALCELQGLSLDTGTGRRRRKPHCKDFGRLSNEEMKECLPMVGTETCMSSIAVYDRIVVSHSGVICTYMMEKRDEIVWFLKKNSWTSEQMLFFSQIHCSSCLQ